VAEEIEQRIANLKAAAELTGSKFDENEFRDYLQEQGNARIDEDDFKIDIWNDSNG